MLDSSFSNERHPLLSIDLIHINGFSNPLRSSSFREQDVILLLIRYAFEYRSKNASPFPLQDKTYITRLIAVLDNNIKYAGGCITSKWFFNDWQQSATLILTIWNSNKTILSLEVNKWIFHNALRWYRAMYNVLLQ